VYRALYAPSDETKRDILPALAFSGYAAQSQEPDMNEGFDEIRGVNFVWKGSDEQRKKWDMWILDK
jgi:bifunctional polynucleotide phosphatase/kinase